MRMRGFSVLVFLRHWMTFPGMAPTYVLLCPLISDTSDIPPTLNLKYYEQQQGIIGYNKCRHRRQYSIQYQIPASKEKKYNNEKVKYCIVKIQSIFQFDFIATWMSPIEGSLLLISKISKADSATLL